MIKKNNYMSRALIILGCLLAIPASGMKINKLVSNQIMNLTNLKIDTSQYKNKTISDLQKRNYGINGFKIGAEIGRITGIAFVKCGGTLTRIAVKSFLEYKGVDSSVIDKVGELSNAIGSEATGQNKTLIVKTFRIGFGFAGHLTEEVGFPFLKNTHSSSLDPMENASVLEEITKIINE